MSQTIATLPIHSAGAQGWLEMGDLDTACGPRGSSSGKVEYTSNCNEYENGQAGFLEEGALPKTQRIDLKKFFFFLSWVKSLMKGATAAGKRGEAWTTPSGPGLRPVSEVRPRAPEECPSS